MNEYGVLSLIPPLLAIVLAIRTRQVIFSLILGIFVGWLIIDDWNPFIAFISTLEAFVAVFKSNGSTRTILFTLLIGALIQLIKFSGGVNGFIHVIQKKLTDTGASSKLQVTAALTGFLIFIESNISILTVGTTFKPLFDKYGISKEKLAYLADSSSAPSCILFPLNAWGAYILGLLAVYDHISPLKVLLYSIPFNFYAILTLLLVFFLAFSGKNYGPMKRAEMKMKKDKPSKDASELTTGKASNMIFPLVIMIVSMPLFLVFTGWTAELNGTMGEKIWMSISNGSGSAAVMYAVATALFSAGIMYASQKLITLKSFIDQSLTGMTDMLVMSILMVLAFSIGNLCNELGTGTYVAEATSSWLKPQIAPLVIFLTSCFVAFSTGTSWGTFAIMISIAVPLSAAVGINPHLAVAAVLGGGVFGDHCSPISDTTLIASMATGCDHIEHVRTQLPYALFTGSIASLLYLLAGFLLY